MSDNEYSNADMQAVYESGVEQGRADMEHITAERDRLRDQNADLLGQIDAVVFAHNVLQAERNRLREALESHVRGLDLMKRLMSEGRGANGKLEDIRIAIIYERVNAVAALQEAGDE